MIIVGSGTGKTNAVMNILQYKSYSKTFLFTENTKISIPQKKHHSNNTIVAISMKKYNYTLTNLLFLTT